MVSKDLAKNLRTEFYERLRTEGLTDDHFHKADILRININDDWLKRFLIHHDEQVPEALAMLWDTLVWRKENNVNDINENTVNQEFIRDGSMFLHSQDIDGKILLIFKCKMHIKGVKDWEENKRCIIYWFERAERFNKGDKITIFFDMEGSGLSNMDMDYTKYLIGLCKQYYPNFLNYILIFEMPWVMNAAFKVIKSWLPTKAVEKIKFLNRSSLKDYVLPQFALSCWGGEDNYQFEFKPEPPVPDLNASMKRVHFIDSPPGDVQSNTSSSIHSVEEDNQSVVTLMTKLRITPSDVLAFNREKNGDVVGTINIRNSSTQIVAFKIKTTSPEKFRVRPGSGTLGHDDKVSILVSLQDGVVPRDVVGDKFLVMSTLLEEQDPDSVKDLVAFWKSISPTTVDQHRLKCTVNFSDNLMMPSGGVESKQNGTLWRGLSEVDTSVSGVLRSGNKTDHLYQIVQSVSEHNQALQKQLQRMQYLLLLILALVVVLIGYTLLNTPHWTPGSHHTHLSPPVCDTPPARDL